MSTRAYASAGARLRSLSLRIGADEHPYYLHTPRTPAEPAPGWYWRATGAAGPSYLGYNSFEADHKLRTFLELVQQSQPAVAA